MRVSLLEKQTVQERDYRVHLIHTNKFKTISIIIHMKQMLDTETITKRALLPYVLQSATEKLQTSKEVRQALEQLYGTTLSVDLAKKGDHHIILFRMELGHQKFLAENVDIVEKGIALLSDVLLRPKGYTDKAFDSNIVRKEKRNLKQKIEAIYDDKIRYANMRLIQAMFDDDPYSQSVYGNKESIDTIDEKNLFAYYEQALHEDSLDFYIVGDVTKEDILPLIKKYFVLPTERKETEHRETQMMKRNRHVKEVFEEQQVNQGKLNIGYRTNVQFQDEDYPALQVFNGIFGGFSHSKLFINVREKESLAYYASSLIESHKGLLIVMSGIDSTNYDLTVKIINEQMHKMKQGEFTQDEFLQTKTMLINQILESLDEPRGIVNLYYNEIIANVTLTIDEVIQRIENVTREDVINVANKIEQDTIYFLKGKEETN